MGARPLRRAVQRLIEDPLAEEVLRGTFRPGDHIHAEVEDEKIVFRHALPDGDLPALEEPATVA
jgi:ATP-dependent Clp protease ATP-binding subunit ClpA